MIALPQRFDHESPMSPLASGRNQVWPGVVDSLPGVFADYATEPAFSVEGMLEATVCLWRQTEDDRWHVGVIDFPAGADPDGAVGLFAVLMDGSPEAYRRFAEEYYEQSIGSLAADVVVPGPAGGFRLLGGLLLVGSDGARSDTRVPCPSSNPLTGSFPASDPKIQR